MQKEVIWEMPSEIQDSFMQLLINFKTYAQSYFLEKHSQEIVQNEFRFQVEQHPKGLKLSTKAGKYFSLETINGLLAIFILKLTEEFRFIQAENETMRLANQKLERELDFFRLRIDDLTKQVAKLKEENYEIRINFFRRENQDLRDDKETWKENTLATQNQQDLILKVLLEMMPKLQFKESADQIHQKINEMSDKNIINFSPNIKVEGATSNLAINSHNTVSDDLKVCLETFLKDLSTELETTDLSQEDKEDIEAPMSQIATQVKRNSPKMDVINGAVMTLNNLMTGITANKIGQPILDQLAILVGMVS